MRLLLLLLSIPSITFSQFNTEYEVSSSHPFGILNPDTHKEVGDFDPLIGTCDCISTRRNPDQSWDSPKNMVWTFKYIMNGNAVQDETMIEGGSYAGSRTATPFLTHSTMQRAGLA